MDIYFISTERNVIIKGNKIEMVDDGYNYTVKVDGVRIMDWYAEKTAVLDFMDIVARHIKAGIDRNAKAISINL